MLDNFSDMTASLASLVASLVTLIALAIHQYVQAEIAKRTTIKTAADLAQKVEQTVAVAKAEASEGAAKIVESNDRREAKLDQIGILVNGQTALLKEKLAEALTKIATLEALLAAKPPA